MRSLIAAGLVFLLSLQVRAIDLGADLSSVKLADQFDEAVALSPATKWLVFVSDKKAAQLVTEYLVESKFKLESAGILYVSDISGMPSLITKMVALPKMRKYPFKLALDRSGEITKSWSRHSGKVTVIKVKDSKVVSVQYIENREALVAFFQGTQSP